MNRRQAIAMHALHVTRRTGRIVSVIVFVCILAVTANAYTVVMRGGRRVEIPSSFIVTASTLTYEVSRGVQITLNVAAIDIPATEKANNEAPGSLLRRALSDSRPRSDGPVSTEAAPRRTITNRDLEPALHRRRESELAYEQRRKELGLPTVEESRRQAAAQSDLIASELAQTRALASETESYWRARAAALRTETAALDAQLSYVRRQLDEPPFPTTNGSFTTVISAGPFISFGNFGRTRPLNPLVTHRPDIFVAPRSGPQLVGRVGFDGGAMPGQVFRNPLEFPQSPRRGSPLFAPPHVIVYGSANQPYDISYARSQLVTQFNELAAARAGLNARWRELEDEARRAGAPPGWLRP